MNIALYFTNAITNNFQRHICILIPSNCCKYVVFPPLMSKLCRWKFHSWQFYTQKIYARKFSALKFGWGKIFFCSDKVWPRGNFEWGIHYALKNCLAKFAWLNLYCAIILQCHILALWKFFLDEIGNVQSLWQFIYNLHFFRMLRLLEYLYLKFCASRI